MQGLIERHDVGALTDRDLVEYIKMNVLAATDELHEVLNETGWKHWKSEGYGQIASRQRYIDEIADVVLFTLNLLLAQRVSGMELIKALDKKWRINQQRQRSGY